VNDFFKGLTATNLLSGLSSVYAAKEQGKTERHLSEAKTRELAAQARIDEARLEQKRKLIASENARKSATNFELVKMAQWMTMAFAGSLVFLSIGKAMRKA